MGVWRKKLFAANSSILCSVVVLVSPDLRIFFDIRIIVYAFCTGFCRVLVASPLKVAGSKSWSCAFT